MVTRVLPGAARSRAAPSTRWAFTLAGSTRTSSGWRDGKQSVPGLRRERAPRKPISPGPMTPEQAIAEAKSGTLRPVYLVLGEERFHRQRVLAALRLAALGTLEVSFNE